MISRGCNLISRAVSLSRTDSEFVGGNLPIEAIKKTCTADFLNLSIKKPDRVFALELHAVQPVLLQRTALPLKKATCTLFMI
jgi:hypothetical protein